MKPDASNLRKRKLLTAAAEEFGLPAPKHACCEATVNSFRGSLFLNNENAEDVRLQDTLAESTQASNSFPGHSQSLSSTELMFDEHFQKRDSSDEASTSWANSRSVTSGNDSYSLESRILSIKDDDDMEEYQISHPDINGWQGIDCLDDCVGTHFYEESNQKTAEELEEFLSSSGMNTTLSTMLAADKWIVDQEAEMARRKPTIDQEFEQYFSTLML